MKAPLFIFMFLFFQLYSLRNDFIHKINSYYSYITLKIQTEGYNHIFNENLEYPKKIYINNVEQAEVSNQYYLNTTDNIIKLIWNGNLDNCVEMFMGCSNITYIDLSNFNTSSVTEMGSMFQGCSSLKSIDLSNLDTTQVEDMSSMFDSCSLLTTLNLSNFDISHVRNLGYMFYDCSSLKSLNLMNFYTSQSTNLQSMFQGCSSLISLNLSNFNISSTTGISNFLEGCSSLEILDLSSIESISLLQQFFNRGEKKLKYLTLKSGFINKDFDIDFFLNITARNAVLCFGSNYMDILYQLQNITCIIPFCSNDWLKIRKKISKENNECYDYCNITDYNLEYEGECYKDCPQGTKIIKSFEYFCEKICPQEIPFLIVDEQKCISNCNIKDIIDKKCVIHIDENIYSIFNEANLMLQNLLNEIKIILYQKL